MQEACDPIGLDSWKNRSDVINANDGKYVEIIHTSAGVRGLKLPLGTSDFYPNGGVLMPGCKNDVEGHCSHAKSIYYFLNSVGNEYFVATKCKNHEEIFAGNCSNIGTSYMGGAFPKNISGVYHLTTNANRPYYKLTNTQ
ncbi:lipase member H-like [Arctopsyche grandis]|uniref:lipase member H-like n=1 Tax=Arctopsyche grandis TaxID=121162 RepID=UPI00406D9C72